MSVKEFSTRMLLNPPGSNSSYAQVYPLIPYLLDDVTARISKELDLVKFVEMSDVNYSENINIKEQVFFGGDYSIPLRWRPVRDILSVVVREELSSTRFGYGRAIDYLYSNSNEVERRDTTLESDKYFLNREREEVIERRLSRVILVERPQSLKYPNITVRYTAGLSERNGDDPEEKYVEVDWDLKRAVFNQAAYEYRNRDNLGLVGLSVTGASTTLAPMKLLPEVMEVIDLYKEPVMFIG